MMQQRGQGRRTLERGMKGKSLGMKGLSRVTLVIVCSSEYSVLKFSEITCLNKELGCIKI